MNEQFELPGGYQTTRQAGEALDPSVEAIRGNVPPIILTPSDRQDPDLRKERLSDRSSIIHDHGKGLLSERLSRAESHAHSHLSFSSTSRRSRSGVTLSQTRENGTLGKGDSRIESMLRGKIFHRRDHHDFIPLDAQEEILTRRQVLRELDFQGFGPRAHEIAQYICGTSNHEKRNVGKQLFAILILAEKPKEIVNFQRAELFDKDLPFCSSGNHLVPKDLKDDDKRLNFFFTWTPNEINLFLLYQWYMISPFFARRHDQPPFFYPLEDKIVLPWQPADDVIQDETGTHSVVHMIKIHEAHYDFEMESARVFALKSLDSRNKEDFDAEFGALKKFKLHDHLVPVLAAFNHQNRYYLLFPWADGGNLMSYWKRNPKPVVAETILWVAEQCHGLATALDHIHDVYSSPNILGRDDMLEPEASAKRFGRHGDIKPENVLQFPSNNHELGVLKLSDFGLTVFHGAKSKSRDRLDPSRRALTYNPPESVEDVNISRRYDIWCLGCLYLEFVTWLLIGFEGIEAFSTKRWDERHSNQTIASDEYFRKEEGRKGPYGVLKKAVKNHISQLQSHTSCSTFLHDFLQIIKVKMLVVDEKNRIECPELTKELEKLRDQCRFDKEYLHGKNNRAKSETAEKLIRRLRYIKLRLMRIYNSNKFIDR